MKRSLLALAIVVLVFVGSVSYAAVPFRLGLRTGVNFSNASFDPDVSGASKSSRTTFAVGAIVEIEASENFSVAAEPMYIQKGVELAGGGVKVILKPSFFEIPVLLKARFGAGSVKPYFFAGPTIGFTTSSKIAVETGGLSVEVDAKDSTSSTDFGLTFGGGAEFGLNESVAIVADVRYGLGLSDLHKAPLLIPAKINSNGVQILIGVLFRVGN